MKNETPSVMRLVTPKHSQQLSLRLTDEQREYVQRQQRGLQADPRTSGFNWSEANVIRTLIERARRTSLDLTRDP